MSQKYLTMLNMLNMAFLHRMAYWHNYISSAHQHPSMPFSTSEHTTTQIKRIPVKTPTWQDLHDLKEAGQSYDDLLAGMIRRERDYRDWKIITEIDRDGEFVAFNPEELMKGD